MADITSRPCLPDPAKCCDACVFGRGEHAAWCTAVWCTKCWHLRHERACSYGHSEFHRLQGLVSPCKCEGEAPAPQACAMCHGSGWLRKIGRRVSCWYCGGKGSI